MNPTGIKIVICDWWEFTGVPFPGPDQVAQFLDIK